LESASNPMIIIGSGALAREDGEHILYLANEICNKYVLVKEGWNGYNVLHRAASRVGGLDVGFVPAKGGCDTEAILKRTESGEIKLVYLLGADEINMSRLGKAFVIYQGHHGDAGAHRADVVLPGVAYTEKDVTFVNTEGRVQHTTAAVSPKGDAKLDWIIVSELANALRKNLEFNSIESVREAMGKAVPHLAFDGITPAKWENFGKKGSLSSQPLVNPVKNFYMTDPISRASKIMAECTSVIGSKCNHNSEAA
jgi:NADH-quinone oxidoreductase subunit G